MYVTNEENLLCHVECTQFLRRWKHKINKLKKEHDVESAGISIASMAVVASQQLHDQQNTKLHKPALRDETSSSQLGQLQENVKQLGKKV